MSVPVRNLAVMFTDIKGFTARTAKSSRDELVDLLERHERLVLPVAEGRGGKVVKGIGDSFLIVFDSATNAVISASEILRNLRQWNRQADAGTRIELRIGIHIGEVTLHNDDVFGDAVNVAARVEAATEAMEASITESVFLAMNREEIADELKTRNMRLVKSGTHRFKGVSRPVRLYRIEDKGRRRTTKNPSPTEVVPGSPKWRRFRKRAIIVGRRVARTSAYGLTALGIAAAAVAVLLQSASLVLLAGLYLVAVQPWRIGEQVMGIVRGVCLVAVCGFFIVLPDTPTRDVQERYDSLAKKVHSRGAKSLTFADRLTTRMLTLALPAALTLQGDSAAGREAFYLLFRGAPTRTWKSDQPMRWAPVRARIATFAQSLDDLRPNRARVSLPLSPLESGGRRHAFGEVLLEAEAERRGRGWHIAALVTVDVGYPNEGRVWVGEVAQTVVTVDTELFRMLEADGKLFPYASQYRWSLRSDDLRLSLTSVASR